VSQGPGQTGPVRERLKKKPGRKPGPAKQAKKLARPATSAAGEHAQAGGVRARKAPRRRKPVGWSWVWAGEGAREGAGEGGEGPIIEGPGAAGAGAGPALRGGGAAVETDDKGTQTNFDLDGYLELVAFHNRIEALASC